MVKSLRSSRSKESGIVLKMHCCLCDGHKLKIRKAFEIIGCDDEFTVQPTEGTLTMSTACSRQPDELISALAQYYNIKAELLSSCKEDDHKGPQPAYLPTQKTVNSTQQRRPICEKNHPDHYLKSVKRSSHSEIETTTSKTFVTNCVTNDCILKITHPGHHHPLVLWRAPAPYDCNGCKEKGFRSCFKCDDEKCNFYLHEECAEPKPHAHHKFLKSCDLIFHKEAPTREGGGQERYCDACGMVLLGFRYQCSHENAHDLHPTCLKLPWVIEYGEIKLELRDKVGSNCLYCGKKEISQGITGWAYASTSSSGDCFHISCIKEIIYDNWKKAFLYSSGKPSYPKGSSSLRPVPNINNTRIVKFRKNSTWRSNAIMLGKIAKVVLEAIISVLTGNVSGLILAPFGF